MKKLGKIIVAFISILLCLFYLFPFYIVIVNAFKNRKELYEDMLALPQTFTPEYFLKAFQTIMMPLLQVMGWVKDVTNIPMVNSLGGLIYMNVGFGASMAVFLYHGFIKTIPVSLEEAATIDGCNKFSVFWRIVFPILKPTTVTVMILDVIWIWNDYLLPLLILSKKELRTIPLSTSSFFGQFTNEWNLAMAGLLLTIVPVIIFYLAAQKYIVKGVAAGAVKM
ncbi:MAG: sugar transporter permease [Herbinix sp.]|nr:sugar transporter permease [Herbinix sp.]